MILHALIVMLMIGALILIAVGLTAFMFLADGRRPRVRYYTPPPVRVVERVYSDDRSTWVVLD